MKLGLTKRQTEVLSVIRDLIAECGHAPTYEQICAAGDIRSLSSVHRYVYILRERGHLDLKPLAKQSIVLL